MNLGHHIKTIPVHCQEINIEKLKLNCPITSVRRALTNLTNDEKLVKTDDFVKGNFGKKEHLWRLRTAQDDIDPNQYTLFGGE